MTPEPMQFDDVDIVVHNSPVPYYFQLCNYIEKKIRSKELQPGRLMPSEEELCQKLRISRTVVRQAMAELEQKGLITKQSGKRSTVALPRYEAGLMQSLCGFYEDAISKGQRPSTRVLDLRVIPAEGEVSTALSLNPGELVIRLHRVRYLNEEPQVISVTHLVAKKCPDLINEDLPNRSLYDILGQKYGLVVQKGFRTIEAIALERGDARIFQLRPGSPALLLTSIGLLEDGSPLEYFIAKHRGDRSRFQVRLVK